MPVYSSAILDSPNVRESPNVALSDFASYGTRLIGAKLF